MKYFTVYMYMYITILINYLILFYINQIKHELNEILKVVLCGLRTNMVSVLVFCFADAAMNYSQ